MSYLFSSIKKVRISYGLVDIILAPLGPAWGHLRGYVGPSWGYVGPVGPSWGYVGPASAPFGAYVGPC